MHSIFLKAINGIKFLCKDIYDEGCNLVCPLSEHMAMCPL